MKEQFVTPKLIKEGILRGIRTTLLEVGSATKVELSNKLEISFPTISKFIENMKDEGEVFLVGLDDSSGGRRAKRYAYNPEHTLGLSIFLEKNETNYIIFNCFGEVKEQGKTSTVLVEEGLDVLSTTIEAFLYKFPKVQSVTIGIPGSVDNGHIFYIPGYENFQDFNLKGYLEQKFSLPVLVENDMNAAVFGYHDQIGTDANQSMVYLYSGKNGPGAGIMINGNVVRGSTFFSGEVSFIPQYDNLNFLQALEYRNSTNFNEYKIDAISRLISAFVAIINPHTFIFCNDEFNQEMIVEIEQRCAKYIPIEHLPKITVSDWKEDYLHGLKKLGLELIISNSN